MKGTVIKAKITGIENYGIFVTFQDGYAGLVHISELSNKFVKDINSYGKVGDEIYAEIIDVDDESKKIKLSMKNLIYKKNHNSKKRKIIETKNGFNTLKKKLPYWIDEALKNSKNVVNTIDKH